MTARPTLALRMVNPSSRGWSHLREVVLAMLLEASEATNDTPLYTSYTLFTLRLMESSLPEAVQMRLLSLLEQSRSTLQPPILCGVSSGGNGSGRSETSRRRREPLSEREARTFGSALAACTCDMMTM